MFVIDPFTPFANRAVDVTNLGNDQDTSDSTSYSTVSYTHTEPTATRRVWYVVCINALDSVNIASAPTVSINGSSSGVTVLGDTSGQHCYACIAYKEITSGTSANTSVTWGQTMVGCGIRTYEVITYQGRDLQILDTQTDTSGTLVTGDVTTLNGGAVFMTAMGENKSTAGSWSGATERVQTSFGTNDYSIVGDSFPLSSSEDERTVRFTWAASGTSHRAICVSICGAADTN